MFQERTQGMGAVGTRGIRTCVSLWNGEPSNEVGDTEFGGLSDPFEFGGVTGPFVGMRGLLEAR